jgi:hypothetical protein
MKVFNTKVGHCVQINCMWKLKENSFPVPEEHTIQLLYYVSFALFKVDNCESFEVIKREQNLLK